MTKKINVYTSSYTLKEYVLNSISYVKFIKGAQIYFAYYFLFFEDHCLIMSKLSKNLNFIYLVPSVSE